MAICRGGPVILDSSLPPTSSSCGGSESRPRRGILAEITQDDDVKEIPVVILTSSEDDRDIVKSHRLHASCYITKPVDLAGFMAIIEEVEDFWLTIVQLPPQR